MHRALLVMSALVVCGTAVEAAGQSPSAPAPSAQAPSAQAPSVRLLNAKLQAVPASGSLTAQFKTIVERQAEPAWIAYVQPIVDGTLGGCCWDNWSDGRGGCCGGCALEDRSGTIVGGRAAEGQAPVGAIKLEGPSEFIVLFRVEQRRVDRVRVYSADCDLDAGGLPVHLLTGVRAADSVALLESVVATWPANERKGAPDASVMGIALHRDPAADAALQRLLATTQPDQVRKRALFWTARARGRAGFEMVRTVLRDTQAGAGLRKEAVFALTQSREPEVVPTLIDAARTHPVGEVRGQALFWLAQKAGKQAEATITRAIDEDPDTAVKERAVFALSQLPKDDGVPLLIQVARTNKNPAVRKRAMFWLGQSKDPRAIDFFESILK